jgi:uncharacterized protein
MRNDYLPGVPCWIDTAQPDPRAAVAFYGDLFGWDFTDEMPPDSPVRYFVGRLRGGKVAAVTSSRDGAPPAWHTYIAVADADETAARVTGSGGHLIMPPMDMSDAGRMAVFTDPARAALRAWQAGQHRGAERVNEPGTWNWSDLNTRDMTAAKAFYAAVFGWEASAVDFGSGEAYMLRRPGYGDFLERDNPGIRQIHMDAGAPEGFTDAIAWMQPMSGDQSPDTASSHWSVTFSVDDPDAIASRAAQLGGTVTVPPFDVPFARTAVITDPQGAVFTASKYIPPS